MKILVLPYTHTLSHLSRPLEISKYLKAKGHDIHFAGNSQKIDFIKAEDFELHPLFEPNPITLFGNIRKGKIKFIENNIVIKMIDQDLDLFKSIRPDIIISDGRFSAMISAQLAGIKHISIVNASSTAFRSIPYIPFIKAIDINVETDKNICKKIFARFNLAVEKFIFNNTMSIFQKISSEKRLKTKVTATNCLCGTDLTLIADMPDFFPTRNLPSNYIYIGPITWKSPTSQRLPAWWPVKKNRKKLVYITMGTTGESGLFQKIYNTLKHIDNIIIVITTGNQSDNILSIPEKIYVTDFMDGDAIMDLCDLVICHGGNGTIYQALSHAVPIIGIPTIPDQNFNMRRVESLNLGHRISMKSALEQPENIIKAIENIERNKKAYTASLTEIRQVLSKMNGAKTGSEIILGYIRNIH